MIIKHNSIGPDCSRLLAAIVLLALPTATLAAPLLANGGFEALSSGGALARSWTPYGAGYALDSSAAHSGLRSIRCTADSPGLTTGASCLCVLDQTQPEPIVVSGWSRAEAVSGSADTDYSVYVDITYTDGTPLYGQTAPFDTGTHPWQRRHVLIIPEQPVKSMIVYALFRNHTGTVWFDDFSARQESGASLFDSQAIAPPALGKGEAAGWFVRDVAAGGKIVALSLAHTTLGVAASLSGGGAGGKIQRIEVRNTLAKSRALTIYYAERIDASSPIWWRDIRTKTPAAPPFEYANSAAANVGANGRISLYPFGCVTSARSGEALDVPATLGPCVVRIGFSSRSRLLYAAFDIALTRAGATRHSHASLAIVRYPVDPEWGFRDAAAKYYALFPQLYRRRTMVSGIWMPFTAPETIAGFRDFHIGFHEGDNSVAADRASGILSFRYIEPMTYWMAMPKGMPRTYDAALALVRQQAAGPDQTLSRQAQAVLSSGAKDTSGRYRMSFQDAPWCDGAVWILDPEPGMPHRAGQWTSAMLDDAAAPSTASGEPDGEYLDSLEAHADVLDYGPAALHAAGVPLTYTADDFQPVAPTWFGVFDEVERLSKTLHKRGKLLMANTTPWRFFAPDPYLDAMGTELSPFSDTGVFTPEPDSMQDLRRTLAGRKPYLVLADSNFSVVGDDAIRQYLARNLFYGIFPSLFSADAANNPYWQNPALYNRDRPLFETYIPQIRMLSTAGWQPVTYAVSSNPAVWLERFGDRYLTVLNPTKTAQSATISIEATKLFGPHTGRIRFVETDGSRSNPIVGDGRHSAFLTLAPGESCILTMDPGARAAQRQAKHTIHS